MHTNNINNQQTFTSLVSNNTLKLAKEYAKFSGKVRCLKMPEKL